MSSLTQCKELCECFVRNSLPAIRQTAFKLPTLPKFRAAPEYRPGRTKFVEETRPNWWQLPKEKGNISQDAWLAWLGECCS